MSKSKDFMSALNRIVDAFDGTAGGNNNDDMLTALDNIADAIENGSQGGGGSTGDVMIVHVAVNDDDGEYVVQVEEQIEDIFAAIRTGKLLVADVNSDNSISAVWDHYFYLKNADISTEYDEFIEFKNIVVSTDGDGPNLGGRIDITKIIYEGSGEEGVDGYWWFNSYGVSIPAESTDPLA